MFATLWAKLWVYVALVLIAAGFGAGIVWYWLSDTIAELRAERKELRTQMQAVASARKAEQKVTERRADVRSKRAGEAAAAEERERKALGASDWAKQPIPQEVRDAMAE